MQFFPLSPALLFRLELEQVKKRSSLSPAAAKKSHLMRRAETGAAKKQNWGEKKVSNDQTSLGREEEED